MVALPAEALAKAVLSFVITIMRRCHARLYAFIVIVQLNVEAYA